MSETTYPPVDRTGWSSGTWDGEPDRAEWYDEKTGMPCLAKRNAIGAWCGYVAVNPGHPLHGVSYADITIPDGEREYDDIEVHGGLTYSDHCSGGICHVPRPGEPDNVWWFGFDCAHSFDYVPGTDDMRFMNEMSEWASGVMGINMHTPGGAPQYRDLDFVKEQCTQLAAQLWERA